MVIISDCLTEQPAEGCLKIAYNLIKRIKERAPQTMVITYGKKSILSSCHMKLNRMFLNMELLTFLRKKQEPVLYIPNASCTLASAVRTWVLAKFTRRSVNVLFVQWHGMNPVTRHLLKQSGAAIICVSRESARRYEENGLPAVYLKTGVDTDRFQPVDETRKQELRRKYHLPEQARIVLHVGHLKEGRNLDKFCLLKDEYLTVLVISTVTVEECGIREQLAQYPNISILDTYIENIEEIYQLADVYFFPVLESGNCIDVPLSVLEAAACGLPILTTRYGELREFVSTEGFCFLEDFEPQKIHAALDRLYQVRQINMNREAVLAYGWNHAVSVLTGEHYE